MGTQGQVSGAWVQHWALGMGHFDLLVLIAELLLANLHHAYRALLHSFLTPHVHFCYLLPVGQSTAMSGAVPRDGDRDGGRGWGSRGRDRDRDRGLGIGQRWG